MPCSCHSDDSMYGTLADCPKCGHRSFDALASACERRKCGYEHVPRLETDADRERQHKVGEYLAKQWDLKVVHMPDLHPYDFEFYLGEEMVSIAELKCRDAKSTDYPDWWLSVAKYNSLRTRSLNAPLFYGMAVPIAYAVFRFTDPALYVVDITKLSARDIVMVEREKPRKSGLVGVNDTEPAYRVPLTLMERMDTLQ